MVNYCTNYTLNSMQLFNSKCNIHDTPSHLNLQYCCALLTYLHSVHVYFIIDILVAIAVTTALVSPVCQTLT